MSRSRLEEQLPVWKISPDAEGAFCLLEREDGLRAYVARQEGEEDFLYYVSITSTPRRSAALGDLARIQELLEAFDGPVTTTNQSWGNGTSIILFRSLGPRRARR